MIVFRYPWCIKGSIGLLNLTTIPLLKSEHNKNSDSMKSFFIFRPINFLKCIIFWHLLFNAVVSIKY